MSESKRRIYMALAAVAIAFWGYNAVNRKNKQVDTTPQPIVALKAIDSPSAVPMPEMSAVKNKPWATDPFYHRQDRSNDEPVLTRANFYELKAIIYNETAPSAFLNGRVVRLGDTIDGAKVIRISKRAVTIEDNGREIIVTLNRG